MFAETDGTGSVHNSKLNTLKPCGVRLWGFKGPKTLRGTGLDN